MKKLIFSNGFKCPMCDGQTAITSTLKDKAVRFRKCANCGYRYKTVEILEEETELAEYEEDYSETDMFYKL